MDRQTEDIRPAMKPAMVPAVVPSAGATSLSLDQRLIMAGVPEEVLAEVRNSPVNGRGIVDILLQKKAIAENDLLALLGVNFDMPVWEELPTDHIKTEFTGRVPIQYLKRYKMVPLETKDRLVIAVNDPFIFQQVDDLCRLLERSDREIVLAPQSAIQSAINLVYEMSRHSAETRSFQRLKRPETFLTRQAMPPSSSWLISSSPGR